MYKWTWAFDETYSVVVSIARWHEGVVASCIYRKTSDLEPKEWGVNTS